ncbi:MAG: SH3 domain-containing protein [Alphaproteobacteria bacterium]|nr:SH3 domain-containing protein [Alphaproteobacteria bacterium]
MMKKTLGSLTALALLATAASPALAKEEVALARCDQSLGSIAIVEGDTQGWAEYGLGSPRELVNALASESGCFTPHSPARGTPADFLMNVVAGDSEEVDQSIEMAKSAATEALVRSGALASVASRIPIGGALIGMFGGLGGKKKRVAAGIKLLSPATGQTIATGSGEVRKTSLGFGGGNAWTTGANAAGYGKSKEGKMLVEAFVLAFNQIAAQQQTIAALPKAQPGAIAATAEPRASAAVDTVLRSAASADATELRTLRAGTALNPTGQREGLFIEVEDNFGTRGWVTVEDLG